jgi:acetoin utilization deacetylase AcuC-like enzyme
VSQTQELFERLGYRFTPAVACSDQDILRVHTVSHFEAVRAGKSFDADTPNLPGMFDHAKRAAGAALQAAELAIHGEPAFSLMRPPGHHATRDRLMGFCYFNNMAIAVAAFLEGVSHSKPSDSQQAPGQKRVAILDFDCHHGNGTEEIFRGRPNLLFVSLHQTPCYPGTGLESTGNCLNYPLPPGTGEKKYLATLENALAEIAAFHADLLGVSAGFDAYKEDPITEMNLEISTFKEIGRRVAQLKLATFSLLEGGYSARLPQCIAAYCEGLAG